MPPLAWRKADKGKSVKQKFLPDVQAEKLVFELLLRDQQLDLMLEPVIDYCFYLHKIWALKYP